MPTRRDFIKGAASTAAIAPIADDLSFKPIHHAQLMASDGLHSLAAAKNMFFGTATSEDRIIADASYRTALQTECGIIVPEYEMKWDRMRPTATTFNYSDSDYIINFARQNKLAVRGHTLCWHRALPSWFSSTVNRSNAAEYLTRHITAVCGRYRGQIHSWDVVNEAIEPADRQINNLRNSPWFQLLGESYIETAFRAAYAADPAALLTYNEYGMEYDDNTRRDAILGLLRRLRSRNVPIHCLGIQGHLAYTDLAKFTANMNSFRSFLREVAALGIKIIITEFDCDDRGLPSSISARDEGVGKVYGDYCSIVMNEPAVIGFMAWGLTDKYTSLNMTAPRSDRQLQRPLPLDAAMTRKNPWYALEFWFKNTSRRAMPTITDVRQEHINHTQLFCYPNPATHHCTIEFSLPSTNDVLVRLTDTKGRDVRILAQSTLSSGNHVFSLDVSDLPSGAYMCIVQSASLLASVQVLVKK